MRAWAVGTTTTDAATTSSWRGMLHCGEQPLHCYQLNANFLSPTSFSGAGAKRRPRSCLWDAALPPNVCRVLFNHFLLRPKEVLATAEQHSNLLKRRRSVQRIPPWTYKNRHLPSLLRTCGPRNGRAGHRRVAIAAADRAAFHPAPPMNRAQTILTTLSPLSAWRGSLL